MLYKVKILVEQGELVLSVSNPPKSIISTRRRVRGELVSAIFDHACVVNYDLCDLV